MELTFLYPYWGSEEMDPETFISFCLEKGFSGIEINFHINQSSFNTSTTLFQSAAAFITFRKSSNFSFG